MVRASLRKQLVSRRFALGCSVAALLAMPSAGRAQGASAAENKPFAEHRLVLQLSDRAEDKQALVLSVAYTVIGAVLLGHFLQSARRRATLSLT